MIHVIGKLNINLLNKEMPLRKRLLKDKKNQKNILYCSLVTYKIPVLYNRSL